MKSGRRRKLVLAALMLYWPAIFVLTHLPQLPQWVLQTQLDDKTPHFLAYLGLVFLWWFSISPYKRVNWFKARAWVTIAVMAIYAILDEWLQAYVGRTPDVWDFAANMTGVMTGLLLLTVLDFWVAAMIVGGAVVFGAANLMQIDLAALMPRTSPVFFLAAYAMITGCWICHLGSRYRLAPQDRRWLPVALLLPLALLAIVHGYASLVINRRHISPVIAGLAAVITVVGTVWLAGLLRRRTPRDYSAAE